MKKIIYTLVFLFTLSSFSQEDNVLFDIKFGGSSFDIDNIGPDENAIILKKVDISGNFIEFWSI